MTSRYILKDTPDICAFCENDNPRFLFVGVTGKCICDACVGYVHEEMELGKESSGKFIEEVLSGA